MKAEKDLIDLIGGLTNTVKGLSGNLGRITERFVPIKTKNVKFGGVRATAVLTKDNSILLDFGNLTKENIATIFDKLKAADD